MAQRKNESCSCTDTCLNGQSNCRRHPEPSARGALPFDDCAGVPNEHAAPRLHQPGEAGFVERRKREGDRRDGQGDTYFDAQGFERRRGPGRRLSDFSKAAEEGNLTKEQFLFIMAIETFKRANQMAYPSWTDVLEVVRLLGYRKTMPSEIQITAAEDWQEIATTPSNVRPPRWAEHTQRVKQRGAA
jgi:hypothetical protein